MEKFFSHPLQKVKGKEMHAAFSVDALRDAWCWFFGTDYYECDLWGFGDILTLSVKTQLKSFFCDWLFSPKKSSFIW